MNIIKFFNQTIDYIETTLEEKIDEKKIVQLSGYSYPMFSRIFSILTNYSLSEYIRLRKLTKAAFDLRENEEKVIDIAFKYQYESPDSFSLAFKKYHNCTPMEVKQGKDFKIFSPIHLSLTIKGGKAMEISIKKKEKFIVGGVKAENIETVQCPKVWEDLFKKVSFDDLQKLGNGNSYGVCYETTSSKSINYIAAFDVKNVSEAKKLGLDTMEIPEAEYAVVKLKGKIPNCIHEGWKYVMEVFFPEHGYKHAGTPDFEVYTEGDMESDNYEMELWVPIIKAE